MCFLTNCCQVFCSFDWSNSRGMAIVSDIKVLTRATSKIAPCREACYLNVTISYFCLVLCHPRCSHTSNSMWHIPVNNTAWWNSFRKLSLYILIISNSCTQTSTSAPSLAAVYAAYEPQGPPPTTTMSGFSFTSPHLLLSQ